MSSKTLTALFASVAAVRAAVTSQPLIWDNVRIGGGGGFVPSIVFNPNAEGLAYARSVPRLFNNQYHAHRVFSRTDIGGVYKLDPYEDSWLPLLDFANDTQWDFWGTGNNLRNSYMVPSL